MKKVCGTILAFLMFVGMFGYEFTVKATPTAMFPFLTGGDKRYAAIGGGGFIDAGIDLFDLINVGPEFGFIVLPKNSSKNLPAGVDPNLFVVPIGAQVGAYFYPFSRVEVGTGIAGGVCLSSTDSKSHYAPWYRIYGEANFRINSTISVGLNASWLTCQNNSFFGNPGAAGISAGVSVRFKFDTQKVSGNVTGKVAQDESVFPLMYSIYKENPIGTITIDNDETAEIRNVVIKFRSENYTVSEYECGKIKMIRKHKSAEVPLFADFSETILQFSEAGKISGEIVVEYEILGDKRIAISPVTIPVYNRNQVRWFDPAAIASFISSKSTEVMEFSKNLVGIARNHLRTGLNRNMQFAMYLEEGIRIAGIRCETSPDTPYDSYHIDPDELDYIQYPYQTLTYKSGDKDDVGVLFMAMLESVGIKAAFIPLENDFIVAFNLGLDASKADTLFDGYDRILVFDDEIWIPIAMSSINEGFINGWYKAIIELQTLIENEEDFDFIILEEAWQAYQPAGFSSGETSSANAAEKTLISAVETDISRYITAEFGPQIAGVQNRIKNEGASVALYNQLGMLYVRAGMYSSAIPVYELSAKMGSIPAMNNLGNICSLQKKYAEAKSWYEKVLAIDPENKTAIKNLGRIETELEK